MFDFHEKRRLKSYLYSKPTIAILFIAAGFLSFSVYTRFGVEREMAEKREVVAQELEALKVQANALESQVTHLKSERGIEEEIRNRYQVSKKGEQVVVVLDGEEKSSSTEDTTPQAEAEESWFESLW